jgi:predicted Zn-dependent peptidase
VNERYARQDLDGGLVVLTEEVPGVHSVALGIWVRTGSIHEVPAEMGVSHLLEHMVFKGTEQRTARDIALVLERLGGSLDAYTTREHTSYQARVLDEHADIALEVLADLVLSPLLRAEDLELEREVVLEEIATVEDTPDDLVFDLHSNLLWGEHPYGYSILGTRESVSALMSEDLRRIHQSRYHRGNLVIAAAGRVDHARFVEQVSTLFAKARPAGNGGEALLPVETAPRCERMARPTAQSHLVFGKSTFGHSDRRRFALVLLSNALGGGMSSRLFQRVREELGLAYAVYTYQSFYRLGGMVGVYVGTRPEWADRAEDVIREELARAAREGLSPDELTDAKGQVKGQVVLSLESTAARLHRLAGTALYDEPFRTVEEVMRLVDAVTADEIAELAAEYLAPERQTVLRLGPDA